MPHIEGKGSFRGAKFVTVDHELTGGRRQPTYALPYEDRGAISVDLGRVPRRYRISCYVAGDDYRARANALLEALEEPFAGTLVHPVYGRLLCTIGDDVSVKEDTRKLGVVDFSFTVTEALDDGPQAPKTNTATAVKRAATSVRLTAAGVFANPYKGLKQPALADWVQLAHLQLLDTALTSLRKVNGAVAAVTSVPSGIASNITAISQEAAALVTTPGRLLSSVFAVTDAIASAIKLVRDARPDAQAKDTDALDTDPLDEPVRRTAGTRGSLTDVVPQYAALAAAPAVKGTTPARLEQAQGQLALQTCVRAGALSALAEAALDARYDSASDARRVRDVLSAALRDLANQEPEPDAQLAETLRDLAAKVTQHLSTIAGTLADLGIHETGTTLPAEVIAHQLYGDAERADEIVLMNRPLIRNPGAVPGGTRLEVWR